MNSDLAALLAAVRGPILLISLGGLFLIDRLTPYGFWKTWPVLVILLGALKLVERLASRGPRQFEPREGV